MTLLLSARIDSLVLTLLLVTVLPPLLVVSGFRVTMWPQLLVPAAIVCFVAGSFQFVTVLGSSMGNALGTPPVVQSHIPTRYNLFQWIIPVIVCAFGGSVFRGLYGLRSASRSLVENSVQRTAPFRRALGMATCIVVIAYACLPAWWFWRSAYASYGFASQERDEAEAHRLLSRGIQKVGTQEKSSDSSLRGALKLFEMLAIRHPDRTEFRLGVATCHYFLGIPAFTLGRYRDARREFEVALQQLDQIPVGSRERLPYIRQEKLVLHALVLATTTAKDRAAAEPDLVRAIALARRAVTLDPRDSESWRILGVAQLGVRDYDSAIESFQQAMDYRGGGDSAIWFATSIAHALHGDQKKARYWFDKGVEWMNSNRPADEGLRMLYNQAASVVNVP